MSDGANFRETDVTYKAKANFSELLAQVAAAQAAIAALRNAEKKANDESLAENDKVAASRQKAADAIGKQTAAEKDAAKAVNDTTAATVKETKAATDDAAAKDTETAASKKATAAKKDEKTASDALTAALGQSLKAYKDAIKASTDLTDAEKKAKAATADHDYFASKLKNSLADLSTTTKELVTSKRALTDAEKAGVAAAKDAVKVSRDLAAQKRAENVEQAASQNIITRSAVGLDSLVMKAAGWLAMQGRLREEDDKSTVSNTRFSGALDATGAAVGRFGDFLGKVGTQWLPRFVSWMDAGIQRLMFWKKGADDASVGTSAFVSQLTAFQRVENFVTAGLSALGNGFMSLSTSMSALGVIPVLLMTLPALIPVLASVLNIVGPLVAGIGALGVGTMAFASNLSTLASGLVGVVPLLAGLATGYVTLKMAMSGLTGTTGEMAAYSKLETLKSTPGTTPAQLKAATQAYQASLAQLTPAAQTFAKWMQTVSNAFSSIQKKVQQNFFGGFVGDLSKVNGLLKPLQGLLTSVATALGKVADMVVKELTGSVWTSAIHDLTTSIVPLFNTVGKAMVGLLDLFARLSVAAMPFATKMVDGLAHIAMSLSAMLDTPSKAAGFTAFLDTVWKRLLVWLDILKNIGLVFARYSSAASNWSDGYVQGFDKITKGWADLAKAAEEPNSKFKQYLENIKPLLSAIGGIVHQFIAATQTAMMNPTNIKNMTDAVKSLGQFGSAIARLYGTLTKGGQVSNVINVITDVVNLINDLLKNGGIQALSGIWSLLDHLLKFLDTLANMPVVGPLLGTIVTGLSALAAISFVAGKFAGLIELIGGLVALTKAPGLINILSKLPVIGKLGVVGGITDTAGISVAARLAAGKGATAAQLKAAQTAVDSRAGAGLATQFDGAGAGRLLMPGAPKIGAPRTIAEGLDPRYANLGADGAGTSVTAGLADRAIASGLLGKALGFVGGFAATGFGGSPDEITPGSPLWKQTIGKDMTTKSKVTDIANSANQNAIGGFLGLDSHVFQFGTTQKDQDTQLAKMVKTGDLKDAQHAWQDLVTTASQYGITEQQLASFYPKFAAALGVATGATKASKTATDAATQSAQNSQSALQSQLNDYKALGNAQDNANIATKNVSAALKANGTSLSTNTVAGRANLQTILTAVQQYQAYGAALGKVKGSTAQGTIATLQMSQALVNSMVKMGISRTAAESLIKSLLGIPKNISINTALKNAEALAKGEQTKKFLQELAKGDYTAILKGNYTPAQKAAAQAALFAKEYAKGDYLGIMKGSFTPAEKAAAQAKEYAILFAKGDYKGIMRGDFTPAQKAAATAAQKAKDFARARYEAELKASASNANANSADAARKARSFASGYYRAQLTASASAAIAAAQDAVYRINQMRATIIVNAVATGSISPQQARNALWGATGGLVPQHFANGGQVQPGEWQASSTDTVPAMLSPGEFVMRKRIVDAIGVENLRKLNAGMTGYAQFISGAMQQVRPVSPQAYTSRLPPALTSNPGFGSGQSFGNIIINNPVPERASDTLPRTARKMGYLRPSR